MDRIEFAWPTQKLFKSYSCADMHFHTNASDGAASVGAVLSKIKRLGIWVAITDHNEVSSVLGAIRIDPTAKIIPGIEAKFREDLDILFYFYKTADLESFFNNCLKNNLSRHLTHLVIKKDVLEIINISKKFKCISCFAHPYKYRHISKFYAIIKLVDAIEVINSGKSRAANLFALKLANKYKKPIIGGSDGHSIFELGDVVTYSKAKDLNEFLDNILKNKNDIIGKELKLLKLERYFYHFLNRVQNIFNRS